MIRNGQEYGPIKIPTGLVDFDDMELGVYELGVRLIDDVIQVDQWSTSKYINLTESKIGVLRSANLVTIQHLGQAPLQVEIVSGDDATYGERIGGERAYTVFAEPVPSLSLQAVQGGWEVLGDNVQIRGDQRLEKFLSTIALFSSGKQLTSQKRRRR